ncbi:MAG: YiiX/YebB-like N1pC/P60 family cysteine hydrolase [Hyphomicrobiaceae bacterium]
MLGGGLERLTDVLDMADALGHRGALSESEAAATLDTIYEALFHADFAAFDMGQVRQHAPVLVDRIWTLYLALRDCIPAWHEQGVMSHRVQARLRDVFRSARYARDLIGEIALAHPRLGKKESTRPAFSGPAHLTHRNPRFSQGPLVLRPGDAILQRGMAHNSAAISRIGDVDSQFSHVSIVARDPKGGHVMVEALIEDGSIVKAVDDSLSHNVGRAVLLRHRSSDVAERAADMIRDAIARADGRHGPRILYDFTMELGGYGQLYCAKLVRLAYSMATSGDYRIPTYTTRLDMKNRDFIGRIGVTAVETFAPGDIELEPEFDVVAEWRDLRVTSELRLKDMIMMKLFEWMEVYDYRFRPTLLVRLVGSSGVATARMPGFVQVLTRRFAGKVPPNMSASAVGAVAMLHWTAEELYEELRDLESRTIRQTGRQLHPRLVLDQLERMREARGRRIGYLSMPNA